MNQLQRILTRSFLFSLALGVVAAPAVGQTQEGKDLETIVRQRADLSTFRNFTETVGVYEPLRTMGADNKGYTIFIPSNNAWSKLPPQVLGEFQRNRDLMEQVLKYHMVPGRFATNDVTKAVNQTTLQGEPLEIGMSGRRLMAGSAMVIEADQMGSNGVIHIVDRVLLPPTIRNNLTRRALLPLNDARAAYLGRQPDALAGRNVNTGSTRGITGGAASQGSSTFGMGGNVSTASGATSRSGRAARLANAPRAENLMELATSASNLSTFQRLATEAGIGNMLMEGSYTIFAPTDAAFAALPPMAMDALTADKELLRQVLMYHVVRGETTSDELRRGTVRSAGGGSLMVRVGPKGEAKVNDAIVLQTDMLARNGAIHTINRVLVPPAVMSSLRTKGITIGD